MFMTKREKWLIYGLMILATLVTVVPFLWMIITSFKTQAESIAFPPILLPANPGFQAYDKILHEMPFGSFYFNSIVSCSAAKFFAPKRIKLCTAATERKTAIAHGAN